jgi:hypothetical protein
MEKMKEPPMIIGLVNSAAIIGIATYFYKVREADRADLVTVQRALVDVLRRLQELEKKEASGTLALHGISDQIKNLNEETATKSFAESLDTDITEIVNILQANNLEVERPSLISHQSKRYYNGTPERSSDRFERPRLEQRVDVRDQRDTRPSPSGPPRSQYYQNNHPQVPQGPQTHQPQSQRQDNYPGLNKPDNRYDQPPGFNYPNTYPSCPSGVYDPKLDQNNGDDSDLINSVRRFSGSA